MPTAQDRLNIHGDLLGDQGLRKGACGGPPWPQGLLTSRCRLLREPVREGRLGCRARSKAAVGGTSRGHRVMLGNGVELPFLQRPWVTPPGGKLLSSTGVSMPNEMNVGQEKEDAQSGSRRLIPQIPQAGAKSIARFLFLLFHVCRLRLQSMTNNVTIFSHLLA
jgi:hypothetical protein